MARQRQAAARLARTTHGLPGACGHARTAASPMGQQLRQQGAAAELEERHRLCAARCETPRHRAATHGRSRTAFAAVKESPAGAFLCVSVCGPVLGGCGAHSLAAPVTQATWGRSTALSRAPARSGDRRPRWQSRHVAPVWRPRESRSHPGACVQPSRPACGADACPAVRHSRTRRRSPRAAPTSACKCVARRAGGEEVAGRTLGVATAVLPVAPADGSRAWLSVPRAAWLAAWCWPNGWPLGPQLRGKHPDLHAAA